MQIYISGILYVLLIILIAGRIFLMYRRGIRAIVFNRTDKSGFILLSAVLFLTFTVSASMVGFPIWYRLMQPLWNTSVTSWMGLLLCAAALVGIATGLKSFKDSFRVGIDEHKPDALISGGLFSISRNPMYVCFMLFFFGMFLVHGNMLITFAIIIFSFAIHCQILSEEVFLTKHYGKEYEDYCRKVRRYL